jgi:hypothetical protein
VAADGTSRDQVWVVAIRNDGIGNGHRYIEYLDDKNGYYGPLMVDSGLTYNGASTTTITGLSHLNGLSVTVLGNGAPQPNKTVVSGQITGLSPAVTRAEVGLSFTPTVEPLRPVVEGIPLGGLKASHVDTFVAVQDTIGLTVNGDDLSERFPPALMDSPPPLFTGDIAYEQSVWDPNCPLVLTQPQPLPWTILGVYRTIVTNA